MHKFDLDYTAGAITNAYFIWANEGSVPTPSGEAYFIKSNIPWQTLLSGPLTNTGAVTFNSTLAVTGAATFNTSVSLLDNDFLYLGTGTDFRAFHNGTDTYLENSTGELRIMSNDWALRSMSTEIIGYDTTDDYVKFSKDARWIDNEKVLLGTGGDLQVYHDGTNSAVNNLTGNLYIMNASDDKDILFQSDNGSGGVDTYFFVDGSAHETSFFKQIHLYDNVKAVFGASSDLQIYHDGSNSYIKDTGTGNLTLDTDGAQINLGGGGENFAVFRKDTSVDLYYNGSKKFETTNTGATVSGDLLVSSGTDGDAIITIQSDTDNNNENDSPQLQFKQDGGNTIVKAGITGDADQIFTSSLANAAYFGNDEAASVQFYTNATAKFAITNT